MGKGGLYSFLGKCKKKFKNEGAVKNGGIFYPHFFTAPWFCLIYKPCHLVS